MTQSQSPGTTRRQLNQSGFSMVELLAALAIAVVIMGVSLMALTVTRRADSKGSENLTSSNSAFLTGSRFADDVASVGPVNGISQLVDSGQSGCGDSTSAVRLIGPAVSGTGVQVRSYHVVTDADGTTLTRRTCAGANLTAAVTSTPQSNVDSRERPLQRRFAGCRHLRRLAHDHRLLSASRDDSPDQVRTQLHSPGNHRVDTVAHAYDCPGTRHSASEWDLHDSCH
ncbi:MAG: prepilin-type N-terminal cleavage/methylation domain-containing protein [Microthrixaceae bacterium]